MFLSSASNLLVQKKGVTGPVLNDTYAKIMANKPPWGYYDAANYNTGTNTLIDSSSNGRNATLTSGAVSKSTGSGNGASATISFISSSNAAVITWPNGSIPTNFTMCSLTRYSNPGVGQNARILTALNQTPLQWLHGHWSGSRGVTYYNTGFNTTTTTKGTLANWLNCCGKNSATPNNILIDGVASGTLSNGTGNSGGGSACALTICGNEFTTNWAFSQLYIFDQILTDAELVVMSNALNTYLTTGTIS